MKKGVAAFRKQRFVRFDLMFFFFRVTKVAKKETWECFPPRSTTIADPVKRLDIEKTPKLERLEEVKVVTRFP